MKNNVRSTVRTAMLIALLISVQFITKSFGQFVTGTAVNLILSVTVITCGIYSGVIVAMVSPFLAFVVGIGPALIQIVPAVAIGNIIYVIIISMLFNKNKYVAITLASIFKFASLFFLITKLILPSLGLPEKKVAVMSASFSWPQLVTAMAGGMLSLIVIKAIKKYFAKKS